MLCAWACAASNGPTTYQFNYSTAPFTFAVARSGGNGDAIFNTGGTRLVFKVRRPDQPAGPLMLGCGL